MMGPDEYSNYAAAKMAVVGFSETLAKEGKKYNIHCNVLAPGAASRLTQTVWTPDMMEVMKPDWVVPIVGVLCHADCKESGSIFEAAAGHFSKIRWERSRGWWGYPDESLTADVVLKNHDKIVDFTGAEHPNNVADSLAMLEKAKTMPNNQPGEPLKFKDRVVLVTGGGDGLGRAYAIAFARLGAKVAVNDVKNAQKVTDEIKSQGGEAIALEMSVEDGAGVVKAVIDNFKRIDVVVNNAGILRDKVKFARLNLETVN
jgi:multifunctional beta-oxidation protein